MSSLVLKLIALGTMLIDHVAACLNRSGHFPPGNFSGAIFADGAFSLYWFMRAVGRIAFPIFCFQLVEGAIHTKNKGAYATRIAVFALISEFPFDLALDLKYVDWTGQNVFLTLLIGLMLIYELQWADNEQGRNRIMGYIAYPVLTLFACMLCRNLLKNDYSEAGILAISVMGLLSLRIVRELERRISTRVVRLLFCMVASLLLIRFTNDFESWCLLALVPIGLYNGNKGYKSRAIQYGAYLFYPAHLMILGLLAALPVMLRH